MADQTFQYRIVFASTAERTGARNTVEDLKAVDNAVRRVNLSTTSWASNSRQISDFLHRTSSSAKVGETAFYDLDKAMARTANTVASVAGTPGTASRTGGTGGRGVAGFGTVMQSAGYQVQDFAVQVSAGTSAITAFGQQAPQLLGVFGPAGAVAGAAVSIGALITGIILKTRKQAEEGIKIIASIEEVATNAAKRVADETQAKIDARNQELARRQIEAQPDTAGMEAQADADERRKSVAEQLLEANRIMAELMGRHVTAVEEIAAQERRREQERQAASAKEIEAENKKVEAAKSALDLKIEALDANTLNSMDTESDLEKQREIVETLRARRDALKELAAEEIQNPALMGGDPALASRQMQRNTEITNARDELKDNGGLLEQELEAAEAAVEDLESKAEGLGKSINSLSNAVLSAHQTYERQVDAAEIAIESIEKETGMQEVTDRLSAKAAADKAIIEQAREMVGIVEKDGKTASAEVKAAAASITEIISDGKITKDEMVQLGADMQMIISQFKGQNGRLISINEGLRDLLFAQDMRIQKLESDLRNQNLKHGTPQHFR
jgi:hypothetical protein